MMRISTKAFDLPQPDGDSRSLPEMETGVITQHISRTPGVCGGKACVDGTRIRVQDIYVWHVLQGQSPEEIVANFPRLSMADVHAALAYYWDHRDEIHEEIKRGEEMYEELKRENSSPLRQRMMELGLDPNSLPS
jgi:uncharacterized protein (DUF433 family)